MDFLFRPLKRTDFSQLQKWLSEPHVKTWWHDDLNEAEIEAKYGPRVDGIEPTHVFIILYAESPIGLIQFYLWKDYPEHAIQLGAEQTEAGIDLLIGEAEMVGKGFGALIIRNFVDQIVFADARTTAVVTDPEEHNLRSLSAFGKAGFVPLRIVKLKNEDFRRQVVILRRQAASD